MMNHVMVDCETLSTEPYARILSIGACMFDHMNNTLGPTFYAVTQAHTQPERHVSQDTVKWWDQQPEPVRREVFGNPNAVDLTDGLLEFRKWVLANNGMYVWSYGATADIVWLKTAFADRGLAWPFHYRDERCFRTLSWLTKAAEPIRLGAQHHALDDAMHQARWALRALRSLPE